MLIANKNQKISQDERMIREQLLLHPRGPDTGVDIAALPICLSLFILLCLFMKMNEVQLQGTDRSPEETAPCWPQQSGGVPWRQKGTGLVAAQAAAAGQVT
jgi:hypothetical protein